MKGLLRVLWWSLIVLCAVIGLAVAAFGGWYPRSGLVLQDSSYQAKTRLTAGELNWMGQPALIDSVPVDLHFVGIIDGSFMYAKFLHGQAKADPADSTFDLPIVAWGFSGYPRSSINVQFSGKRFIGEPLAVGGTVIMLPALWVGGLLVGLAIVMLLIGLVHRMLLSEMRLRSNTCLHCGHLLIDVDSDECPQCGAVRPLVTVSSGR